MLFVQNNRTTNTLIISRKKKDVRRDVGPFNQVDTQSQKHYNKYLMDVLLAENDIWNRNSNGY